MIYLGLAAYNEERSIDPLFGRIESTQIATGRFPVLVYDDGSVDRTVAVATSWRNRLDLTLIEGGVNQGLGAAIRALIQHFLGIAHHDDVLVLMDCDDTHDPAQIPALVAALHGLGPRAVSIASRYRAGSRIEGVPALRQVASWGVLVLYKSVFPMSGVRDYSCGYRAYTYEALARVSDATGGRIVEENSFASMPELLLRTRAAGAKFAEVPLELHYGRRLSESKMPVADNSFRLLRNLFGWRLRL